MYRFDLLELRSITVGVSDLSELAAQTLNVVDGNVALISPQNILPLLLVTKTLNLLPSLKILVLVEVLT
jgi:hypothetical protein